MDEAGQGDPEFIDIDGLLDDGRGEVRGQRVVGAAEFHPRDVGGIVAGDRGGAWTIKGEHGGDRLEIAAAGDEALHLAVGGALPFRRGWRTDAVLGVPVLHQCALHLARWLGRLQRGERIDARLLINRCLHAVAEATMAEGFLGLVFPADEILRHAFGGGGDDGQSATPVFRQAGHVADRATVGIEFLPGDLGGAELIDGGGLVVRGNALGALHQQVGCREVVAAELGGGALGRWQGATAGGEQDGGEQRSETTLHAQKMLSQLRPTVG